MNNTQMTTIKMIGTEEIIKVQNFHMIPISMYLNLKMVK